MNNPLYKQIRIAWEYPQQPTSLQVGNIRIVRSTEPFEAETALAQTQIDYREYDPSFTSFVDTFELENDVTYYYMIVVYGDTDSTISAATDLYSISIGNPEDTISPNEMHFTTIAGSVDYVGTQGDQILLSDGTIVDVTSTDGTSTFDVPSGKHKVKLVESVDRSNYVSIGGEALVELHNFPTLSAVTKFNFSTNEYNDVPNLTKVPTVLPSNLTNLSSMFENATAFNQDVSSWDVSNVTDMGSMFYGTGAFNQDLSSWNVGKVTDMVYMFGRATSFNSDLSSWNVSSVTDMRGMFDGAIAFNQDLSQWCVSQLSWQPTNFDSGATNWVLPRPVWGTCPSRIEGPEEPGFGEHLILHSQGDIVLNAPVGSVLYSIDGGETWQENSEYGFTVDLPSGVESAVYLKSNDDVELTDSLNVRSTNTNTSNFKGVHQWWDSSRPIRLGVSNNSFYVPKVAPPNVTDMTRMFFGADAFNQPIGNWDVSKVTSMYAMFYGTTAFNQPLNSWDTSNVTDMNNMFTGASAFNSDISQWDVSNVTSMSSMFHFAKAFNSDISQWDVSKVTDMNSMFFGAKAFNSDISQWDVSKVTSMYSIFYGAGLFNQDISQWDVSKVPNMSSMFYGAGAFNQDLSSWCVSKITSKPTDFDYNATKWTLPKPVWGTCPLR